MSKRRVAASHVEWLSLVETSGTFLTVPVVRRVFPNGLDQTPDHLRAEVRRRLNDEPVSDQASATRWLEWVLRELLGFTPEVLLEGPAVPDHATHLVPEHGLVRPSYAVVDEDPGASGRTVRMSVLQFPFGTKPDQPIPGERWAASPIARAQTLVRGSGIPLALATDGDWFSVAAVPSGGGATSATWPSGLFSEEPSLLDSFHALLSARRFFAVEPKNTLAALLAASVAAQEEVTSQLGDQVRRAVELLVAALSRANRARGGQLLEGVSPEDVYGAALTCMMRLVFLLYAEERDLLPAKQELYASSYGVLGLRQLLRDEADRQGDDALERRSSAWHRLLATFRVVHGGVDHEAMRLPGYGGGLFDPDRYPFLEGRRPGEPWRAHESRPLPVDDRTTLAILEALQILIFSDAGVTEARPLSYRSLDVEQIGHVYEGLLDHGALVATDLALGLRGRGSDGPEVPLQVLEDAVARGHDALVTVVAGRTNVPESKIRRDLAREATLEQLGRLRAACEGDDALVERVRPYLSLMAEDLRKLPLVFLPGSVYVTATTERRDTGTQYTPKDLADEIVRYALEPLVYHPGPAETADATAWRIKPPEAILDLKVCDPAVGSGAILVAACRYLSERLIESVTAHGGDEIGGVSLDVNDEDLALTARRLVVDRCLYGVDRNPIAAEMAKLSLWLTTLARERPFTFLDHSIQVGDSLLGLSNLDQLRSLHLDPETGQRLHRNLLNVTDLLEPLITEALSWLEEMSRVTMLTVADAEDKRQLADAASASLDQARTIADAIIGAAVAAEFDSAMSFDERLQVLASHIARATEPRRSASERAALWGEIQSSAEYHVNRGLPDASPKRRALHWPIAFPEVFAGDRLGFDAMVGNPPFKSGKSVSTVVGKDYRSYLVRWVAAGTTGSADLVAYFFLRSAQITAKSSTLGFLATNTISQGDTREVGLDQMLYRGWTIFRAIKSRDWPGGANVAVAQLWMYKERWLGPAFLGSTAVTAIQSDLEPRSREHGPPSRLNDPQRFASVGSFLLGSGFILTSQDRDALVRRDPRNADILFPIINGEEIVVSPDHTSERHAINFFDWPEAKARTYPDCWRIVEERVKPERQRRREDGSFALRAPLPTRYWQYADRRVGLYERTSRLSRAIVLCQVGKVALPVFMPTGWIWTHSVVVFAFDDDFTFGVLTSAFHWWWTAKYASTLESRIRYTPTDVFETFPLPEYSQVVEVAGRNLDEHRRALMVRRDEGLTKTYNRVCDPDDHTDGIDELRRLHVELDRAVADAYGWSDLALDHDFQATRFGVRYTVGPAMQAEILDRLLELNHQRYAREQAAAATGATAPKARRRASRQTPGQMSLVGDGD